MGWAAGWTKRRLPMCRVRRLEAGISVGSDREEVERREADEERRVGGGFVTLEVSRLIWSDADQVPLRSRALPIYIYREDQRSRLAACRKDPVHYYCRICRARLVLFWSKYGSKVLLLQLRCSRRYWKVRSSGNLRPIFILDVSRLAYSINHTWLSRPLGIPFAALSASRQYAEEI